MTQQLFYYEVVGFSGQWQPRSAPVAPQVRTIAGVQRLAYNDGAGPRIRAVQSVPADLQKLTLAQMRECLSPDGRFQGAHRVKVEADHG